jgi:hypothetical protein
VAAEYVVLLQVGFGGGADSPEDAAAAAVASTDAAAAAVAAEIQLAAEQGPELGAVVQEAEQKAVEVRTCEWLLGCLYGCCRYERWLTVWLAVSVPGCLAGWVHQEPSTGKPCWMSAWPDEYWLRLPPGFHAFFA